jgi:lipoic acid synthetase
MTRPVIGPGISSGFDDHAANVSHRKPPWLKKKIHYTDENHRVKALLHELGLHTVCRSARCPNLSECFHHKRATFLILGNACTRRCTFCAVEKAGAGSVPAPDPEEPARVGEAVRKLGLSYAVITSVTRDDLPDGGSGQFARTMRELRSPELRSPGLRPDGPLKIEVLTPDFLGREESIRTVAEAGPDVYNHNVETVPRLYPEVRPGAAYERSLDLLRFLKRSYPRIFLKSGLMVGMGERAEEVVEVLRDLRRAGCDAVTIGQYLRPRHWNLPVYEYVTPETFQVYREQAEGLGFLSVASGPYVRSSYMAHEGYERLARP